MNRLRGKIVGVEAAKFQSIVEVQCGDGILSALALETPATADYLKEGTEVDLYFKKIQTSLGRNLTGLLSIRNRGSAVVRSLKAKGVFTEVLLDGAGTAVTAVISTRSAERLGLAPGVEVEWLVKTHDVTLVPAGGACPLTGPPPDPAY